MGCIRQLSGSNYAVEVPVAWKLKELLEYHGISVYALAEHLGGVDGAASKRPGLYALTAPDHTKRPTRVSFEQLSAILTALNELTGLSHGIADVLEFTPDLPTHLRLPEEEWDGGVAAIGPASAPRKSGSQLDMQIAGEDDLKTSQPRKRDK